VCRQLSGLKTAYLADHPEIDRERNSKYLMADIRSALAEYQVQIFPEELDSHEGPRPVYLVSGKSVLNGLLTILKMEPTDSMGVILASLRSDSEVVKTQSASLASR
jgi:hypothetical protein